MTTNDILCSQSMKILHRQIIKDPRITSVQYPRSGISTPQSSHIALITFTEYMLVIFLNPPQNPHSHFLKKVQVSVFPDAG